VSIKNYLVSITKDSFDLGLLHFSEKKSEKDGGTGIDYF